MVKNLSIQQRVKIMTNENFDDAVKDSPFIVIDCWAPWCGPCRMLSPIIEELAVEYMDEVTFGKLNVDENFKIAEKYNISAIPTLLFFRNGKHIDTLIGAVPKTIVKRKIEELK